MRYGKTLSEYFLLLTTAEQNGFCMVTLSTFMAEKIHTRCPSSTWNIPQFLMVLITMIAKLNHFTCEMNILLTESNQAHPHLVISYNVLLP
jgi:hypothetical protein